MLIYRFHTYSIRILYIIRNHGKHRNRGNLRIKSKEGGFSQKLKVLPITWFYGGKAPAENPFLPRAEAPATP